MSAGDRLFGRLIRQARKWAFRRLPPRARDLNDTADVIQDAAVGVWRNLDRIELTKPGDLEAYLKQAVRNRIRDEARRVNRPNVTTDLDSELPDEQPTPFERVLSEEQSTRFQTAFAQLTSGEREVILARYEYKYTYEQIAVLLDKPSAAAARMAANRAATRLTELMRAAGE